MGGVVRRRPGRRHRHHAPRPLLAALDCKGGPDARVKAERTRRLLHGAGARRVAIWPDEARLSSVGAAAPDLGVLLFQMIETGDGAAAYYGDVMQAAVNLALAAPPGPPANAAGFLDRFDAGWLETAYGDGLHDAALPRIRSARPHLGDIQFRYATLLGRFGPALDGPGTLADADAWYFILEGTREHVRRRGAGHGADRTGRPRRHLDREPNGGRSCWPPTTTRAVSRRVPISNLYERGRSLGLGVQVSAQSWQGLGARRRRAVPDRRHRRRRHLADAHPLPRASGGAGRNPPRAGIRAQAHRRGLGG